MRRILSFFLALPLLLTACGGGTPENPPASAPPPASTPEPAPPEAPSQEEPPSGDDVPAGEDVTLYTCGASPAVEIAIPQSCVSQLTVETDLPVRGEIYHPLLYVYETASLDAAREDFGSSDGFGFLFGISYMEKTDYETYGADVFHESMVFAQDETRVYIYAEPTDVQYYRCGGEWNEDGEFADSWKADWASWTELTALGPQVRADMMGRNSLLPFGVQ